MSTQAPALGGASTSTAPRPAKQPRASAWDPYAVLPPSTKRKLDTRDALSTQGYLKELSIPTEVADERIAGKLLQLDLPEGKMSDRRKAELAVRESEKEKKRAKKAREGDCGLAGRRKRAAMGKAAVKAVRYESVLPVYHLWLGYMAELLALPVILSPEPSPTASYTPPSETLSTPAVSIASSTLLPTYPPRASRDTQINVVNLQTKLIKAEFVGCLLSVKRAKNPSLVGIKGIVLQETQGTFKQGTVLTLVLPFAPQPSETHPRELSFDLYGDAFAYRPADRVGKKWKAGTSAGALFETGSPLSSRPLALRPASAAPADGPAVPMPPLLDRWTSRPALATNATAALLDFLDYARPAAMSPPASSATETLSHKLHTLSLRSEPAGESAETQGGKKDSRLRWWSETAQEGDAYPYERFLPFFDTELRLPPLEPFKHIDPGHKALWDPSPRSFLANAEVDDLTPDFGSEVTGVQLHQLDDRGRQQLALFVAQRGVVAFRDQDFADQDPTWMIEDWCKFFGRPHIHPCSGAPKGYPEFHLVYRDGKAVYNYETDTRLTSSVWHSDVTYEEQPPGLTLLFLFDSPAAGGDTGYADQRGAYNHLSPNFRAYLETLQAVHSGVEQAEYSRKGNRGGIVKREPVENIHPIVRVHPVTGEKALFVNRQFTRRIVGLKQEESDAILNLLYLHIERGADFQVRLRHRPRTVIAWDNRITAHTAIVDFAKGGARRHGARITPQAERPYI
ncbi:Alpha-ketoglutarate-dependent sulfonate dioxygenase [Rhodotorula toruloides]|nr:Alpha-ketoglutarate-dependent sulfonate dioxygenase [Rhodotorula toruloides]